MTEPLTYDSDRLIRQWRERWTGRRTVAAQMLDEAEVLVRDAIAREREQEQRQAKVEYDREQYQREHAVQRAQTDRDRALARAERAELDLREHRALHTNLRESRETVEDGTVVRITGPRVRGYGDKTIPRPWQLGEVEQLIYRLRLAGAEDTAEVRFKHEHAEACVPFPEFALPTSRETTPIEQEMPSAEVALWARVHWQTVRVAVLLVLTLAYFTWVVLR